MLSFFKKYHGIAAVQLFAKQYGVLSRRQVCSTQTGIKKDVIFSYAR